MTSGSDSVGKATASKPVATTAGSKAGTGVGAAGTKARVGVTKTTKKGEEAKSEAGVAPKLAKPTKGDDVKKANRIAKAPMASIGAQ